MSERVRREASWSACRRQSHKEPLLEEIRKIRKETHSVFVSNLPQQISEAEIEAIF